MQQVKRAAEAVIEQLGTVIYGKRSKLELVLTCLLADGQLLLEDVPGSAKTLTLSRRRSRCRELIRTTGTDRSRWIAWRSSQRPGA